MSDNERAPEARGPPSGDDDYRSSDKRGDDRRDDDRRRDDRSADRGAPPADDEDKPDLAAIDREGVKLYVGNLNFRTTEDELRYKFETFGKLMDVFIPKDRNTGDPRGFGFVTFHDRRDAEDAEEAMNEKEFGGRTIRVNFAKKRPPPEERGRRDDRGGGRGYGGGGGGYGGGGGRDRYDDRRGGGGGGYDDRRGGDRGYDDRRGGDRGYDDRRDYGRYDRYDDRRY